MRAHREGEPAHPGRVPLRHLRPPRARRHRGSHQRSRGRAGPSPRQPDLTRSPRLQPGRSHGVFRPATLPVAPRADRRHALDERAEGLTVVDVGTRASAERGRPVRSVVKPMSRASGGRRVGRAQATQGATGGIFRRRWLRFLQVGIRHDSSVHSTRRHSSAFHLHRPCNQEVGVIGKSLVERSIMPRGGILLSAYLSVRIRVSFHTLDGSTRGAFGGVRLGGRCLPTSAGAPTCTGAVAGASRCRHVV